MFGQILKNLRVSDGIPQTRFAKEIGFSQASVAAWENNTREPGIETLVLIAQYFNVTVDYLVTGKGTFSPSITNAAQSALTKDELELIEEYRTLAPYLQEMLKATIRTWKDVPQNASAKKRL